MADNLLVQQPNGEWARLRAVDIGDGVLVLQVQSQAAAYVSGGRYPLAETLAGAGAAIAAADVGYARPFMVRAPVTPVAFGVRTSVGGAGSSFKVGIFANNPSTNRPTGLPLTFNDVGEPTTANNTDDYAAVAPPVLLVPGVIYWMVTTWTGTLPTIVMVSNVDLFAAQVIGLGIGSAGANTVSGLSTPLPYAGGVVVDLTAAVWTPVLSALLPMPLMEA